MISKVDLEVKSFSYHSYFSGHFNKTVKEINLWGQPNPIISQNSHVKESKSIFFIYK